ncbi:hypothetical protein ZYGR_0AL00270 [Zygosaccharomyces rouxii]|uniref:Holocytochrome c-type synthase n=1 Tax=Zygosaccharomyces rouxii TaxID=4956 RepID=A0A1Q3AF96_ZYGRO|nr:hypothetical protein ZYGR_0AL00270 [Zygosaccharomyces rouxii]
MSSSTIDESTESKCPVDHSSREVWLKQAAKQQQKQQPEESKCPVDHDSREVWLKQTRQDVECSSEHLSNTPQYHSNVALPENRQISSIPRTGSDANWVYPSQKQFYEAMLRKNWDPHAQDMQTVVPLHNSVNERVWNYIKFWEKDQGGESCGGIQLTSFKGDSKKLTPRAWLRSQILGFSKPFDRHDWSINRCGKSIDYVIDFYSDDDQEKGPQIYLDVRPKLNSAEGVRLRMLKWLGF